MTRFASFFMLFFIFIAGTPSSVFSNRTIPQTVAIEDHLLLEERESLLAFGVIKNSPGSLPIQVYSNFVPVVFQNTTGLHASQIYLTFHGTSVASPNGVQFIQFDPTTAQGSFVTGASNLLSANYSVQLSTMPQVVNFPGCYLFYVPLTNSGRAYITINQPMFLQVSTASPYSVVDPSPTLYTDPNYYTIYDFYEFTFNSSGQSGTYLAWEANFNTSAVDFFGISSELQFLSYPSGNLLLVSDPTQVNCGPTTFSQSRESIISALQTGLTTTNNSSAWKLLLLPFLSNPYDANSTVPTYLRVLNAGVSIQNPPASYAGPVPFPQNPSAGFPSDYLSNGGSYGENYIDKWFSYYNSMYSMPASTLSFLLEVYNSATYSGPSTGASPNQTLTLTSTSSPTTQALAENTVSTVELFVGTGLSFTPTNAAAGGALSEYVGGAFEVGLFGLSQISQANLRAGSSNYYKNPPFMTTMGPWYDLYASILHANAVVPSYAQVQNFGAVYASPYDDLLGINSSIANKNPTDYTVTPSPYINVTMNSITTIPSIADAGSYAVTFDLTTAPPGSSVSYRAGASGSYAPIATTGNTGMATVSTFPLQVAYVSGNSSSVTRYYTVYLQYQNMQPTVVSGNQYNSIDQGIIASTTIYPNAAPPTAFTVKFVQ